MPVRDFNGDGRDDLLVRHDDGHFKIWITGFWGDFITDWSNANDSVPIDWKIAGIGDFNGDGRADILWRNDDGRLTNWLTRSDGAISSNAANAYHSVSVDWQIAGVGDFNGDNRDDILWRNADGRLTNWLGTETGGFADNVSKAYNNVSTDWRIAGVGDFNGDGRDDILWRNADGRMSNWLATEGGGFADNVANAYDFVSLEWNVAGIGDFNGDGRDDILWRSVDGRITNWLGAADGGFSDNGAHADTFYTRPFAVVPAIADFNGDGREDYLWQTGPYLQTIFSDPEGGFYGWSNENFPMGIPLLLDWHVQPPSNGTGEWDY